MKRLSVAPAFWMLLLGTLAIGLHKKYMLLFCAASVHELGHGLAIWIADGVIDQIRLIPGGLDIRYCEKHFSYAADLWIAVAGPAANLLLAMLLSPIDLPGTDLFIGLNLTLCFFNLLPIYPLDGGKILYTVMTFFSPAEGEKAFFLLSGTLAALLFAAACGACFYHLRAIWSVLIFGYILLQQKLRMLCKEAV